MTGNAQKASGGLNQVTIPLQGNSMVQGQFTGYGGGFNSPQGLAVGIGGESVFVANSGSDNILEINTNPNSSQFNQIIATVSLPSGSDPQGVACNSTTCFVTDSGTDTVFWFETGSTN
jgi:DNA-binding beta-propeller fold protein YncE